MQGRDLVGLFLDAVLPYAPWPPPHDPVSPSPFPLPLCRLYAIQRLDKGETRLLSHSIIVYHL